jgi:5-methylcytosine-specific restriction endonuclease McrA
MPRARSWTDEQLAMAVAASRTMSEVCRRLGLQPGKYDVLRRHIRRLGLDASHIPRSAVGSPRTRTGWTDDDLAAAVAASDSVSEVSRRLGYTPNGGVHRMIVGRIRTSGLDTSHFTGTRWARGRILPRKTIPLEEILVERSTYRGSSKLRRRLIASGFLEAKCSNCGLDSWLGRALPLHLDHVNGDHTDNRLENLRILCPNCHSQTDTWCGVDRRRSPTGRRPSV